MDQEEQGQIRWLATLLSFAEATFEQFAYDLPGKVLTLVLLVAWLKGFIRFSPVWIVLIDLVAGSALKVLTSTLIFYLEERRM